MGFKRQIFTGIYKSTLILPLLLVSLLFSCSDKAERIKEAKGKLGFVVEEFSVLTLTPEGNELSKIQKKPYEKVIILATPYYKIFEELGTESRVVGMSNVGRVNNVWDHIQSVGEGEEVDLEKIISLSPDLIICNSYQLENLKSLDVPKLACDEYLESSPIGRLRYLFLIGAVTGTEQLSFQSFQAKSKKFMQPIEKVNKTVLKLDNYGSGWFQPGCNTYISNIVTFAGATPVCVNGSSKSEKVSDEVATLALSKHELLLFMDWAPDKTGLIERLNGVLKLDNHPKKLLYCNTTQSDYFQESILNSYLIIKDLNEVLKTEKKGRFFEIITLE